MVPRNRIKLAVADDHTLFRKVLVDYLSQQKNIIIGMQAGDAMELLTKLKNTLSDVVLLDLFMPKSDPLNLIQTIQKEFPGIKIIVVSFCTDLSIISDILEMGVSAYVSKEEDPEALLQAITLAYENKIYRNFLFTEALYLSKEKKINKGIKKEHADFNEREKRIIQLLWEEKNNKEVAQELYLSIRSVEKIRQDMKEKLGVRSITGLFKYALNRGIISTKKYSHDIK